MTRDTRREAARVAQADHPAGVVERDGRVVGAWYSLGREGKSSVALTVQAIGRVGGGLGLATFECASPDADAALAALSSPSEGSTACRSARSRYGLSDVGSALGVVAAMADPGAARGLGGPGLWSWRHVDAVSETLRRRYPAMAQAAREAAAVDAVSAIHRTLSPFMETLDGAALSMAARHGLFGFLGDMWGRVDATCGGSPALRDAIDARPDLAGPLLHAHARDPARVESILALDGSSGAVADWLRRDVGLAPALSRRHEAAARAVATCGYQVAKALPRSLSPMSRDPVLAHVAVMRLASLLPPNWLPDDEWHDFVEAAPVIARALPLAGRGGLATFVAGGPDWGAWLGKLRASAGRAGIAGAVDDLDDPARALALQVVRPALAMAGLDDGDERLHKAVAWRALYHGRTLRRCLAVSAAWHVADAAIRTGLAALPRYGQAPPPPGSPRRDWEPGLSDGRVGELSVRVLVTARELAEEGMVGPDPSGMEGLAHCVGSYADDCLSGRVRVLSVRGRDARGRWMRLSTAEVALGPGGPDVRQHRGLRNGDPPARAARALDVHLAGDCGLEPDAWAPAPGYRPSGGVPYDASVEGNLAAAEALWAPFLPSPLRGIGPDGWTDVAMAAMSDPGRWPWSPDPPAAPAPRLAPAGP